MTDRRRLPTSPSWVVAGSWVVVVAVLGVLAGCSPPPVRSSQVDAGDVTVGRDLITEYGCTGCHVVPGIRSEPAYVGPPLDHWGRRSYIAGTLPNNQENLIRWVTDPQAVEPGTAMPDLGVSEQDARNITAYLLSIE